jgi:hypothetical protein
VLDVHPPHEPIYGWRDFFIHLATITIGLVIALSLEGCVEWRHHRNLVHEADSGLRIEIRGNAKEVEGAIEDLQKEQAFLKQDVAVLNKIITDPKTPNRENMTINFRVRTFSDVSWRTAQATGAFSYMPYIQAKAYANIYDKQDEIDIAERQAVRDTVLGVAPFLNLNAGDANPSGEEAVRIKNQLEILQGQLQYVESLVEALDGEYKKFLAAHPA